MLMFLIKSSLPQQNICRPNVTSGSQLFISVVCQVRRGKI